MFEHKVPSITFSKRIDVYLVKALEGQYSRTDLKKALDNGEIFVNGKPVKARYMVQEGDVIKGEVVSEIAPSMLEPEFNPIKVVYEDEDLMVVDKAAGMVVHPGAGNKTGTLVHSLLGRGMELSDVGGGLRPGIVHRLDKDTSGLLLIAKNNHAHRMLQDQFAQRETSKTYIALVSGQVEFQEGHIEAPIGRHAKIRQKMAISKADDARDAETHYRVLKRFRYSTLVEVRIVTGRTHQIRVHMAHLGNPVVGDTLYGKAVPGQRQALHAAKIEFVHPKSGKIMSFESEIPEDMRLVIEKAEKA